MELSRWIPGAASLSLKMFICMYMITLALSKEVIRPRGVPLTHKLFYDPNKDFSCIDGTKKIPFSWVNDDYCDCPGDGSDEPGTSACSNGTYHCLNIGYTEKKIPSSQVNDGICDCCDGSDEYDSNSNCGNNCVQLGDAAREEARRYAELIKQGSEIREQYKQHAKDRKEEQLRRLMELKEEFARAETERTEKEAVKLEAEKKENEAMERHRAAEAERRTQADQDELKKAQDAEEKLAMEAFRLLDLNQDGQLGYTELQTNPKFDHNADGQVTDIEAKFFLHMKDSMDLNEFISTGWIIMKPYYLKADKQSEHANTANKQQAHEHSQELHDQLEREGDAGYSDSLTDDTPTDYRSEHPLEHDEFNYNDNVENVDGQDDEADEEEEKHHEYNYGGDHKPESGSTLEYDEETKAILEASKQAKQDFTNAESRLEQIQNQIREIENSQSNDYGAEDEYMALHGQCFEYTDREYTYRLCPFDRASQQPKDGGPETNLGRWLAWADSGDHSAWKFDGGATCWNGPARSVVVQLSCGAENRILGAQEPNRCQYKFEFETPAKCVVQRPHEDGATEADGHRHTEL